MCSTPAERRSRTTGDRRTRCDTPVSRADRRTPVSAVHRQWAVRVPPVSRQRTMHAVKRDDEGRTHASVALLHGQPLLTDEVGLLACLQIAHDDIFEEPRGGCAAACTVVPHAHVVQRAQRPRRESVRRRFCFSIARWSIHVGTAMRNESMPPRCRTRRLGSANVRTVVSACSPAITN